MGEEMADFGFRRRPAREKAGYVRRHFNSVAAQYDFMNTLLSLGLHHLWKRAAVRSLGLKAGELLLHPSENRFRSGDLQRALKDSGLVPVASLENRWLGIIGFAAKR